MTPAVFSTAWTTSRETHRSLEPAVWDAFTLMVPVWEKVMRTLVVYVAIAVLVRLAGKRGLAQLNFFDLVVVLLLSNVVQNAIIGDDNSLTGGLLGAVVLVAVNAVIVRMVARSDRLTAVFEGTPTTLVERGRYIRHVSSEKVSGLAT
jgi:uncharacterized membrane protein YcaP (DUF421 family)